MAMEQGLYAQVVTILRNDSDNKTEQEKKNIIASKVHSQHQNAGLIFIISG